MPILYNNGKKADISKFAVVSPGNYEERYKQDLKRRSDELRKVGKG